MRIKTISVEMEDGTFFRQEYSGETPLNPTEVGGEEENRLYSLLTDAGKLFNTDNSLFRQYE